MNQAKTVTVTAVAAFLAALSAAIREADSLGPADYQSALLAELDRFLEPYGLDDSPLSRTDQQNLRTIRSGLQKYLDDPLLSSH